MTQQCVDHIQPKFDFSSCSYDSDSTSPHSPATKQTQFASLILLLVLKHNFSIQYNFITVINCELRTNKKHKKILDMLHCNQHCKILLFFYRNKIGHKISFEFKIFIIKDFSNQSEFNKITKNSTLKQTFYFIFYTPQCLHNCFYLMVQ